MGKIQETYNWWYCDNIVHPDMQGTIALLHLGEPNVIILFRDSSEYQTASFESWIEGVADLQFLYPEERQRFNTDEILRQAWNFASLQEAKEEELFSKEEDFVL